MNDPMGATPMADSGGYGEDQDKRRRNLIIAGVAVAVLLCCCCVVLPSAYLAWTCGDYFLGGPAGTCILVQ